MEEHLFKIHHKIYLKLNAICQEAGDMNVEQFLKVYEELGDKVSQSKRLEDTVDDLQTRNEELEKSNERFEWFLEKASEIGISEITPIICERSERKFINEKRLNKVLVSAMKQSIKAHHPILNPITTLKDFYKKKFNDELFIAHCNNSEKEFFINYLFKRNFNFV